MFIGQLISFNILKFENIILVKINGNNVSECLINVSNKFPV
jgi:hypothetical protein